MNVAVLSGGVGGARFVARRRRRRRRRGDDRDRQRRRRRRGARASRLARPRLDPLRAGGARGRASAAGVAATRRWNALETVGALGGEDWFALGDRDLGLHLVRTEALRAGEPLSAVTARLAASARGRDDGCSRRPTTGCAPGSTRRPARFAFQEWFVARGHRDEVDAVRFEGEETARPAPGVLEALAGADLILLAPSNPYVSVGPILAVR